MATGLTCYFDGPTLSAATAVYTDINLTVLAPDGFYSDGTIVREQVSGVLEPQSICNCGTSMPLCYSTISLADVCCNCTVTPP